MTDNKMKKMENETLEQATAGLKNGPEIATLSNICPRCRSARHTNLRIDGNIEVRRCDVCQFEYYYRLY